MIGMRFYPTRRLPRFRNRTLLNVAVLDIQTNRRADAAEGVEPRCDQRPIAETHDVRRVDAFEELARFGRGEDRRLSFSDDVPRPADCSRGVHADDSSNEQKIEQHTNRSKFLLNTRLFNFRSARLDVGRNVERLNRGKFTDPVPLAPGEEPEHGTKIRPARVRVTNRAGEKFEEPFGSVTAGTRDRRRQMLEATAREIAARRNWNDGVHWR